jgi:hypothetical protein
LIEKEENPPAEGSASFCSFLKRDHEACLDGELLQRQRLSCLFLSWSNE